MCLFQVDYMRQGCGLEVACVCVCVGGGGGGLTSNGMWVAKRI